MWLIHGYLLRTTVGVFLAAVGTLVFLLLSGNVGRDLLEMVASERVSRDVFLQLVGHLVPMAVGYALPIAFLVAVLVAMGRLSADGELTAMKASGLSLWRIAAPLVLLAIVTSVAASWVHGVGAPRAMASYKQILHASIVEAPLRLFQPGRFLHDFDGYVLFAAGEEDGALRDLWIWELDDQDRPVRVVRADRGRLAYEPESRSLRIEISEAMVELRDEDKPNDLRSPQPTLFLSETIFAFDLDEILDASQVEIRLSGLGWHDLLRRRLELMRAEAAASTAETRAELQADRIVVQFHLQELFTRGASPLAFAFLGIALGVRTARRETSVNLAVAFGLALGYYLLTALIGELKHYPDFRPDLLIWAPHFLFQVAGVGLLAKAARH